MKRLLLILPLITACEAEVIRYCNWVCVDDNVEQTATSCAENRGATRKNDECVEPAKRPPELGEDVTIAGFDNERDGESILVSAYVQEIAGRAFVLSELMRPGLLGAGVYGDDGALVGISDGTTADGLVEGTVVD